MRLNIRKVKSLFKDYAFYLVILAIIIYFGYMAYFFYQNFYLIITEKLPLEQIIVKEKINFTLYEKVKENLDYKKAYQLDTANLKDPFKAY